MGTASLSQNLRAHYRWIAQSSRHTTTTLPLSPLPPPKREEKNPKQNKTSQLIDRFAAQKQTKACKQYAASNIKEKTSKQTTKTRRKNEFVVVEEGKPLRLP
jgi:hypothetical protein